MRLDSPGPTHTARAERTGRPTLRSALRWFGTCAIGGYLLVRADTSAILGAIGAADLRWVVLAAAIYALDRIAAAWKWMLLYNVHGRLRLWQAVRIYLASGFLGAALPATVGADLVRGGMVTRRGGRLSHVISSIVAERLVGVASLLTLAAIALVVLRAARAVRPAVLVPAVVASIVVVVGVAAIFLPGWRETAPPDDEPRGLRGRTRKLFASLRAYSARRGVLAAGFGIALGQHLLMTGINWVLALALGLDLSLSLIIWVWPLVMLAVRVPISIMGFGVRELVLVTLLAPEGFTVEQAVALGLLSGAVELVFIAVGAVIYALGSVSSERDGADMAAVDDRTADLPAVNSVSDT